jgi:hypothetical protein
MTVWKEREEVGLWCQKRLLLLAAEVLELHARRTWYLNDAVGAENENWMLHILAAAAITDTFVSCQTCILS